MVKGWAMFIFGMGFLLFPQESVEVWPSWQSSSWGLCDSQHARSATITDCCPGVPSALPCPWPGWPRSSCPHTHGQAASGQCLSEPCTSCNTLGLWKDKHQPPQQPHGWGDVFPCQAAERKRENMGAHIRSFHQTHVHGTGPCGPFSLSLDTLQCILFEKFPRAQIVKIQQFCKLDM